MDIFTRADLEQLMREEREWCVSIYLPTHRTGTDAQQDPIYLKNLLAEAEKILSSRGVRTRDIQKMLKPAIQFLADSKFWQHQSDGLALFLTDSGLLSYRLPLNFDPFVAVMDRFHIKPLLPLFTGDGRFYILALSQNKVRFLVGTRHSVSEVDIGSVADTLAETLSSGDHQAHLQIHTSSAGGKAGEGSVTFHGQGGGEENAKKDLLRYFRMVAEGLMEFLKGEQVPLVLAGVEYLLQIYKEANTYPHVLDTFIKGNPDLLSPDELHKSAWSILEPVFQTAQEEAVAQYQQLAGQGSAKVADGLEIVIPAAYEGRIEILFVATGMQKWGVYHPDTNQIELHDPKQSGDEPLLDLAAVQTCLKGGIIHSMDPEKMPSGAVASAVLRYG